MSDLLAKSVHTVGAFADSVREDVTQPKGCRRFASISCFGCLPGFLLGVVVGVMIGIFAWDLVVQEIATNLHATRNVPDSVDVSLVF